MVFIYALVDSVTGDVRYIGKTNNMKKRYQSHCRAKGLTHRAKWIRSLKKLGYLPDILLIEETTESAWVEAEAFWIGYFSSTKLLTNHTFGGEGAAGYKHTEENIAKMREAKLGKKQSEAHKKAVSEALKGKPKNYIIAKSKAVIITTPTGEQVYSESLNSYCAREGLNTSRMSKVARGVIEQHKGYRVELIAA